MQARRLRGRGLQGRLNAAPPASAAIAGNAKGVLQSGRSLASIGNKDSVDLARQATATGAKIAGACVDLGTGTHAAVGTANALAGLGLRPFQLGIDIKDLRAGNARLTRPDTIDHTVFAECPILGCCLLTCADTSSVKAKAVKSLFG